MPVRKKGDGRVMEKYRGATITDTYKIYESVVAEKLVIEMDRKKIDK